MENKETADKALRQHQTADAIATLASSVLHDLNNILYVLLGNAELGLKKAAPDDPTCKHLNEIIAAARRGTEIGNRMQIYRHAIAASKSGEPVADLLDQAQLLLGALLPSSVEVTFEGDVSGLFVEIESADLHQILLNLCQNASRALGDQGSIRVAVECPARGRDNSALLQLQIRVIDRGCGIEAQDLPRVFSPDFTTKPIGGAAGFGLAVVHGIATEVGGSVSIKSEVHVGTTVEVILPCRSRGDNHEN